VGSLSRIQPRKSLRRARWWPSVGKGRVLEDGTQRKLDVKAGDKILFGKYAGTDVKIDDEDYLIMREDDILGVIEK
jgi:chaperonin GroES